MNIYGEKITVNGYRLTIYPAPGDRIEYTDITGRERSAKITLCKWARGLHGNAPSGTQYGSARVILPDGTRATVPIYL